jgi:hypothetical protein
MREHHNGDPKRPAVPAASEKRIMVLPALQKDISDKKMNKITTIVWLTSAALTLTAAPAGPDGLYLMTRFQSGGSLEVATYWFHDGAVVRNPVASAKSLNLQAERAAHPAAVGTYQLQAGQLTLTFASSNIKSRFEADSRGGGFGWDAGAFSPVEIFKQGATLDGTFSGGASVGGGAVMGSTNITFKGDGTYASDSVTSFSSQGRTSGASGGSVGKERGKYRIDGTALHMIPDGGKETVSITFPYDDGSDGPAPRSVYLGGGLLKRVK